MITELKIPLTRLVGYPSRYVNEAAARALSYRKD
jgi:hypothetical protein